MTTTLTSRARTPLRRACGATALVAAVTLAAGACTHHPRPPHTSTTSTTSSSPVNEVSFELKNGAISKTGDVKPGRNTVHVTNTGTIEHEVIFIKADGGASLPTKANGSVDEAKLPRGASIGEVELDAGKSTTRTFTFTPGKWVAVCNIVSGDNVHFAKGMWMDFSVS